MTFWGGIRHQNKVEILFVSKVLEVECPRCRGTRFGMTNVNKVDDLVHCRDCGSTWQIHFDSLDEREEFLARYLDKVSDDD